MSYAASSLSNPEVGEISDGSVAMNDPESPPRALACSVAVGFGG